MSALELKKLKRDQANDEYLKEYLLSKQPQVTCPYCGCSPCHKLGKTKAGTPRYLCPHCKHTFVYDQKTVFYCTHKSLDQWHRFIQCYQQGQPLSVCAREAQIHRNTALRWRHRVNDALNQ